MIKIANFSSNLAVILVFFLMTSATVYLFLQRKKGAMTLQQVQSIIYANIQDICELALVKKNFKSVV